MKNKRGTVNQEQAADEKRRGLIKTAAWSVPAVTAISLPTHGQMSPIETTPPPTTPPPDVCAGDLASDRAANIAANPQGMIVDNSAATSIFGSSYFPGGGTAWTGAPTVFPATNAMTGSQDLAAIQGDFIVLESDFPCYDPMQQATVDVSIRFENLGPGAQVGLGTASMIGTAPRTDIPYGAVTGFTVTHMGTINTTAANLVNGTIDSLRISMETFHGAGKGWEVTVSYTITYLP